MMEQPKPRSLMGNAVWSLMATGWFTVVAFVLTPFLIARLGTDHYGLYVLLMSISGLLGLMDLGLGEATLRYVAYYHARRDLAGVNRAVGATFSVYILSGLLAWAVLSFGAPLITQLLAVAPEDQLLATRLLRLTAISFGFMLASGAFGSIPKALERYDVDTALMIAQSVFQLAGTVAVLLTGRGVYELVLWGVATTFFRQALNVVVARRLVPGLRLTPSPSRSGLREVFGYGAFATITQMLGTVWREADRLLLGTLVSTSAVAYLTVPKNLSFRGMGALTNAGGVLFPRFSGTDDPQVQRRLFLDATWSLLLATILLFVPLVVLMPDLLRLWIGTEFARESARIGQVIAASCIVRGAFVPYHQLFKGMGKPQYLTAFYFGSGLTNVALNVALIPALGLDGAGYAYAVTVVWGFTATAFAWRRVLGAGSWGPLLRAVALPIGLGFAVLGLSLALRPLAGEVGWLGLLVLAAAILAGTAVPVIGVEWLLGGRGSHAGSLFSAARRLVGFLPWARPSGLSVGERR